MSIFALPQYQPNVTTNQLMGLTMDNQYNVQQLLKMKIQDEFTKMRTSGDQGSGVQDLSTLARLAYINRDNGWTA